MVFHTFLNHSLVDSAGTVTVLAYQEQFGAIDPTLVPTANQPHKFPSDFQRVNDDQCQPSYAIRSDVWQTFFATILFSLRLFIWHDQIKHRRQTPLAKPPSHPHSKIHTLLQSMIVPATTNVFTNHFSPSSSIKSSLSPTTAPASIHSVTNTLHAYMRTMVGGEGVVDEGISTATQFSNFLEVNNQSWACAFFVHQNSVKDARNSVMATQSSTVNKAVQKVLDMIVANKPTKTTKKGQGGSTSVPSLVNINQSQQDILGSTTPGLTLNLTKDDQFETTVWSHLSRIVLESTVGTFRVPEHISDIFKYKFRTIPYWGVSENYHTRGDIVTLVQFAMHIFRAFIDDAIVLAIKWWEEYLIAYHQHVQSQ